MVGGFYRRPGLNIETYDQRAAMQVERGSVRGDVDFYLSLAATAGGTILDLGCGTGRVAIALARSGHAVVGIDSSEAMLAVADENRKELFADRAANLSFRKADMRSFGIGTRFHLAIAAFRSFQPLLTPADQRACLETIRRHLVVGGILAIDLADPKLEWCVPADVDGPPLPKGSVTHPTTGNEVSFDVVRWHTNSVAQVTTEIWRFTERDQSHRVIRREFESLSQRWTYRYEMRYLLEAAGFSVDAEYSDFSGRRRHMAENRSG